MLRGSRGLSVTPITTMSTHLLAGLGGIHGLSGVGHKVLELQGFDEVGVPDETTVRDLQVIVLTRQSASCGKDHGNTKEAESVSIFWHPSRRTSPVRNTAA